MGYVKYYSRDQQRSTRNKQTDTQVSPNDDESNGHSPSPSERRGQENQAQSGYLPPDTGGEVRMDRSGQITDSSPNEPEHRYQNLKRGNEEVDQDPEYDIFEKYIILRILILASFFNYNIIQEPLLSKL